MLNDRRNQLLKPLHWFSKHIQIRTLHTLFARFIKRFDIIARALSNSDSRKMFKSRAILRSAWRSHLSEQTGFLFFSVAKGCTFSCLTLNFLFFYMLTLAGLKNPRSSTIALLGWGYTPSPFFQKWQEWLSVV